MKYILAACIVCSVTILSCNNSKEKGLVSILNLPSKQYTINVDKDTTLQTENGALLKIPKGALKPESGNSVTLEIKEAYSLSQMIKAGLFTQADGKPLSSGGMIHIDAPRQKVSFTQPIQVAIPADFLQDGMQLYKGTESDGKIDWTNPTPLLENQQLASVDSGQILFQTNCATCHAIDIAISGPPLAHFPKRFDYYARGSEGLPREWYHGWPYRANSYKNELELRKLDSIGRPKLDTSLTGDYSWIKNSEYSDLELYACNLVHIYGQVRPSSGLSSQELDRIFRFIQNESDRRNLPYSSYDHLKNCIDSCEAYHKAITNLENKKNEVNDKRDSLIGENGEMTRVNPDSTRLTGIRGRGVVSLSSADYDEKVSPNNFQAVYYQFTFDSFGWYNVDQMIAGEEGVEESELIAKLTGEYKNKVNMFLIIPSVKMYTEGGPADAGEDKYAFYLKNGEIPLPQNVDAYILAASESEQSPAFGLKKFITNKKQEIEISLHAASKDEFAAAMKELDAARLHIKVDDSKNAAEIRKTNTTIRKIDEQIKDAEKLKPTRCDCDCDNIGPTSATTAISETKYVDTSRSATTLSVRSFPNPSTNYFTVVVNSADRQTKMSVRVVDITGNTKDLKNNIAPGETITIGASYKPGIYVLQLMQGQRQLTQKLVKQ